MIIKTRKARKGIVFLIAIISMAVMMIIGATFLQLAMQQVFDAERDLKSLHALAMAGSGVNYMIWNQKYPEQSLGKIAAETALPSTTSPSSLSPSSSSAALRKSSPGEWNAGDQYAAWLLRYTLPSSAAGTLDGYQIVSKGTYRGLTRTVRVIMRAPRPVVEPDPTPQPPPPPVLSYALFSGTGLTISGDTTINGKIGSNLDISIDSGSSIVRGDAFAGGRITTKKAGNITGTRYEHQPQVILTDIIQLANLYAYAALHGGEVYQGQKNFWGNEVVSNRVIYVKGDVVINANTQFSDVVTIVAEGNVTINGNVSSVGPTDKSNLIIISPNTVNLKFNGNADIYATFIAPGINASFNANGNANVIGAAIANSITGGGTFDITYRTPNPNAVITPPPPVDNGDDSLAWTIAAWQEI